MLLTLALCALQSDAAPLGDEEWRALAPVNERFRPWKKNFVLVVWNPDLSALPSPTPGGENLDVETNFQLSIRTEVLSADCLYGWTGNVGYTGTSFWQMFDGSDSSPFRTTDHRPELFFESDEGADHWLFRVAPAHHQSNGESGPESRSWNLSYVEAIWHSDLDTLRMGTFSRPRLDELHGLRVALKVWEEWDVSESTNADIADYYGNFELNADWFTRSLRNSALSAMFRNNLGAGGENRSTVRLEWSFNLSDEIRVMFQYFTGYGLNLLDYDRHQQSLGFGLEISP